jgi:hypothetical protein
MIPHFSYKGPVKMTIEKALQLIIQNQGLPALNYCVNYAAAALLMDPHDVAFKLQLAYVVSNMTHWRANKSSTVTTAEIKECRQVLKKASV